MVEEAPVGAHLLGLDRFEQVLPVVGEGTHQEVLLITATRHTGTTVTVCTLTPMKSDDARWLLGYIVTAGPRFCGHCFQFRKTDHHIKLQTDNH